jgi:hypothetical protein
VIADVIVEHLRFREPPMPLLRRQMALTDPH